MKPIISIIVPIYNAEKYLKNTLESAIKQTFRNIEIILVNDGSKDNSLDICNEYAARDERIIVINIEKNGGVCSARNLGIKATKGEYISFLDSDDTFDSDMFENMNIYIEKYHPDILDCVYREIRNNGEKVVLHKHMHPKLQFFDREYILKNVVPSMVNTSSERELFIDSSSCNKLFKAEIILKHGILFDEKRKRFEDRLFIVEFLHKAQSIIFLDGCYYNYIRRTNSLSSSYDPKEFEYIINSYRKYRELFSEYCDFDCLYSRKYWINLFQTTIFYNPFCNRKNVENLKKTVIEMLQHNQVIAWYEKLDYGSFFQNKLKEAILKQNYAKAYFLLEWKFLPIRLKQIVKKYMLLIKLIRI